MNHVTSTACCHLSRYILSRSLEKIQLLPMYPGSSVSWWQAKDKVGILSKSPFLPSPTGIFGKTRLVLWKIPKPSPFQWFPHSVFESLKTRGFLVIFLFASLGHALLLPTLALGSEVCLFGCRS